MNKFISLSLLLIFTCSPLFAQKSVNSYKYIIVSKQYNFQKSEDSHQVNSLIKFLFERAGYTALFEGENYPEDLIRNNCLALKADVISVSSFLKTKMNIELKDCFNKVIVTSSFGESKEKEYKKAFHESIRRAFVSIEDLNYKYKPESQGIKEVITKQEVKKAEVIVNKPIVEVKKEVKEVEQKVAVVSKVKEVVKAKPSNFSIKGNYSIGNWGKSVISKKGENYSVIGGDENFEFATIYKTSKPSIYIIKWVAFKQPQLVQLTAEGNLKADSESGVVVYKRLD